MNEEELKARAEREEHKAKGSKEKEEKTTDEQSAEEKPADEVEKLQNELDSLKDKYLRLSAEFDNYRKRTMKEKAELILNGGEKCISSILPIVDDFERALKTWKLPKT